MSRKIIDELELRLKAPIVAMERIAEGRTLPKVFADAALSELMTAKKLINKLKADKQYDSNSRKLQR